jgi:hypothetical protein
MSDREGELPKTSGFITRCLSLDLEVGRRRVSTSLPLCGGIPGWL